MKKYIRPIAAALCFGTVVLVAPTSSAQTKAAKLEAIAQQLNLTPQQKAKILPILADEGPKVQAIKNSNSRACRRYSKLGPSIARLTRR